MPSAMRVISAYVVGLILGVFLIAFGIFALVFWFPRDFSFFGMGNVNARQVWTRYGCAEVREILDHRDIIINSSRTNIEIRATNPGQADEGTILLFENARGISFNNLHRTHISWVQELTSDGRVFYSITVHEPTGAVQRDALLLINIISDGNDPQPFNFIFNTGTANVTFAGDSPADFLLVNSVTINSGALGVFSFPPPATAVTPFEMEIGELIVNASPATVQAPTRITGGVTINGNVGTFNLGEVGTSGSTLQAISVPSSTNVVVNANLVHGDINFNSTTGALRPGTVHGNVRTRSATGNVTIARVYGSVDSATTLSGIVQITEIMGNLDFRSTSLGGVTVSSVHGNTNINSEGARATVNLGSGITGIMPGMRGNVSIYNCYGTTNVTFMNGLTTEPSLNFRGFDGNILARNIVGPTDIIIRSGGRAHIDAGFRAISSGINR